VPARVRVLERAVYRCSPISMIEAIIPVALRDCLQKFRKLAFLQTDSRRKSLIECFRRSVGRFFSMRCARAARFFFRALNAADQEKAPAAFEMLPEPDLIDPAALNQN
jgi:hypothetical protein